MKKLIFKSALIAISICTLSNTAFAAFYCNGSDYTPGVTAEQFWADWKPPTPKNYKLPEAFYESYYECKREWYPKIVQDFKAGKCHQIYKKFHNFDGTKCTVNLDKKTNKRLSLECEGQNSSAAMKKLDQMYK